MTLALPLMAYGALSLQARRGYLFLINNLCLLIRLSRVEKKLIKKEVLTQEYYSIVVSTPFQAGIGFCGHHE
ncbi:MAG: hypothetical protein AYP45_14695 [Candidatus Brocadia carolinensis]|uniref:Uncharacterized protein n=1 Tax=Candidatus Brocadia carolinensis TaxID=1004156 RepID=A0A1V4AQQ4_9BACT|nr:MAG: hypothetical protein AYP45_14695 [Candidatus Brocadia caroliniensis]